MENQLSTRRALGSNLPRVGGVAENDDNEDEKIYYGFGVFMGLPLADLKAIKDEFVEQQALTGGPPRRALPPSTVMDGRSHRVKDDEGGVYENRENVSVAVPHTHQQQQQQQQQPQHPLLMNEYERLRCESQPLEYVDGRDRCSQGPLSVVRDEGGDKSDTSDDFGQKSHSLNFILH